MAILAPVIRRDRHPLGFEPDETQTPIKQRRSLTPEQRDGTRKQSTVTLNRRPVQADVAYEEEQMKDTDDLVADEDAPVTRPEVAKVTPIRRRKRVVASAHSRQHPFPWVKITAGLLVAALVLWMLIRTILAIVDVCTDVSNTYHYGPNRTTVVSGVFGHNDSQTNQTEIVAINLHGTLLIEAVPSGDISKAKIYSTGLSLLGDAGAKTPIILTIQDLNGDHKPDVLIQLPGQSITLKLLNTGNDFTLTMK